MSTANISIRYVFFMLVLYHYRQRLKNKNAREGVFILRESEITFGHPLALRHMLCIVLCA